MSVDACLEKRNPFVKRKADDIGCGRHKQVRDTPRHRHTEAVEEVVESDDELKTSYACCCVCRGVRGLMVGCCWGVMVVVGSCLVLLSHEDNILWLRELTDKGYRHKAGESNRNSEITQTVH